MQIILNGNLHTLTSRTTLHDLVSNLNLNNGNIAVAVNQNIIPKSEYLNTWLSDGDKIEIVTAFQGG